MRVLLVLLGAAEFPRRMDLSSPAFAKSHIVLRDWLLDEAHGPMIVGEDCLDLFDSPVSWPDQEAKLADWLVERTATQPAPTDLIVHYVGHGGFRDESRDYYLAIRATRAENAFYSSIMVDSLWRTLRSCARRLRRFLIVDACFAAAAARALMAPLKEAVKVKVRDLQEEEGAQAARDVATLPDRGTAVLCSSSARDPASMTGVAGVTQFTDGLMQVLKAGSPTTEERLSLAQIHALVKTLLVAQYGEAAVTPELHAPDQRFGLLQDVPIFPNLVPTESAGREAFSSVLRPIPMTNRLKIRSFVEAYLGSRDQPVPFGGRRNELETLDEWLGDQAAEKHLLVTAPAGRGKTSLIVNWLRRIPKPWKVAFVPISIRFETNHATILYEAMAHQLAHIADQSAGLTHRDVGDFYRDRCLELLYDINERKIPTIVIVDGLDEAVGWDVDRLLLQCPLSGTLRVLVSARTLAGQLGGPAGWLMRLEWGQGLQRARSMEVPPLTRRGIGEALESMGYPVASLAARADIPGELERLTEGDPLLVRMYAESLWKKGEAAQGLMLEDLRKLDTGYRGFFVAWFEKEIGSWSDPNSRLREKLEAVLAILSVTLGPIEWRHLETLCGDVVGDRAFSFSATDIRPIRRFLIGDGRNIGFSFQHPKFSEYFQKDHFGDGVRIRLARQSIMCWIKRSVQYLHSGTNQSEEIPTYILEHCISHVAISGIDRQTLEALLSEGWQRALFRYDQGYARYSVGIATLKDLISKTPDLDRDQQWIMRIRCGLILSSVRSIGVNVPPALLVSLVKSNKMSGPQALHRLSFQSSRQLANGLLELFDVVEDPTSKIAILEAAEAIGDDQARAKALGSLAERLAEPRRSEALERALTAVEAIRDDRSRAEALGSLAGRLPDALLERALTAAEAIRDDRSRAETLGSLAGRLPDALLERALTAAEAIGDDRSRAQALGSLAGRLPEPRRSEALERALTAAEAIRDDRERAELLDSLTDRLAEPRRSDALLERALTAAEAIGDDRSRAQMLGSLAERLAEPRRSEALERALTAAEAIRDDRSRAQVLGPIAERLAEPRRSEALERALTAVEAIRDDRSRAETLGLLAERLPDALLERALTAAEAIRDDRSRAETLGLLAKRLPDALLERALTAAEAIRDDRSRAQALGSIAERLPEPRRSEALERALTAAEAIRDDGSRAQVPDSLFERLPGRAQMLCSLAERLPEPRRSEALERALTAAEAIRDDRSRAQMLGSLAERLREPRRSEALEQALAAVEAIGDDRERAEVLGSLAERLPDALLERALITAKALAGDSRQAEMLASLAERLPEPRRSEALLDWTLAAAEAFKDATAKRLGWLAERLQEPHRSEALERALTAAEAIRDEWDRAQVLGWLAGRLPDALLERALTAAEVIGDDRERAETLGLLAERLAEPHRSEALERALTAAEAIGDDRRRAEALDRLTEWLPDALLERALTAAEAIGDDRRRAEALGSLAERLPEPRRSEALERALTAAEAIGEDETRAKALGSLAERLAEPRRSEALERALTVAEAIGDDEARAKALGSLAERLAEPRRSEALERALTAAEAVGDDEARAKALGSLAERLPEPRRSEALERALTAAEAIGDNFWGRAGTLDSLTEGLAEPRRSDATPERALIAAEARRAETLGSLAERLPEPRRSEALERASEALERALTAAEAIRDDRTRAETLGLLAQRLPEPHRSEALEWALTAAEAIEDYWQRAETLGSLAERLTEPRRSEALERALTAVEAIGNDWNRVRMLGSLTERLPDAFLERALMAAEAIRDDRSRAETLGSLAGRLQEPRRSEALERALMAAEAIRDDRSRAEMFGSLAGRLQEPRRSEALERALTVAEAIRDDRSRAETLGLLAERLPDALLERALTATETIKNNWTRSEALGSLARWLPDALLERALTAAEAIRDDRARVRALKSFAACYTITRARIYSNQIIDIISLLDRKFTIALLKEIPDEMNDDTILLLANTISSISNRWK